MKIALVVLDTLRKDKISPYNTDIEYTDNIQQFSEKAKVYKNAVTQAPWSLPSQTSLLTGKYPWQHEATQKKPYLSDNIETLPEKLPDNMKKVAIHDNTWLLPITNTMKGFDEVETPSNRSKYLKRLWRYGNDSRILSNLSKKILLANSKRNINNILQDETNSEHIVDKTEEFIQENKENDFFLYLNLLNTHYPYSPPEDYRKKHGVVEDSSVLDSKPSEYGGKIEKDEKEVINSLYNAEVDYLDDIFGKIMQKFKEADIFEETIIIVVADHGEALGEKETFGHHFSTQDELIEVPLIIKTSNSKQKEDSERITELREVHYKILNYSGIDVSDEEKLFENKACGLYEEPVIYSDRLCKDQQHLNKSQFYIKSDKETLRTSNASLQDLKEKHKKIQNQKVAKEHKSGVNREIKLEGIM